MKIPYSTDYIEFLESIREIDAFITTGLKQSSRAGDKDSYTLGLKLRQEIQSFTQIVQICVLECEHLGEMLHAQSPVSRISFKIRKQPKSLFEVKKAVDKIETFIERVSHILCFANSHQSDYVLCNSFSEVFRVLKDYLILFVDC